MCFIPTPSIWTNNPSGRRHVQCLSGWRTPLIHSGEGFCDKHATSHQHLSLNNRIKEMWATTRVSHLSIVFGLQPRSWMSVFNWIWAGLSLCVCTCSRMFLLLAPVIAWTMYALKHAMSSSLCNSKLQVLPLKWLNSRTVYILNTINSLLVLYVLADWLPNFTVQNHYFQGDFYFFTLNAHLLL